MDDDRFARLEARISEQQEKIDRLELERQQRESLSLSERESPSTGKLSRASLLKAAVVGAAGVAGAGALLAEGTGIAGATGAEGQTQFSSATTTPTVTVTNTSSGQAISAHSLTSLTISGTTSSTSSGAIAVEGIISSGSPGVASAGVRGINSGTNANGFGVYGTHAGKGYGVVGTTPNGVGVYGSSTNGTGIVGASPSGIGIAGSSGSTATVASAVEGTITSTSPGSDSAGVRGVNNGASSSGYGVYGHHAGYGYGVYGDAPGGYGVYGASNGNYGVYGYCPNGGYGVYCNGNFAVGNGTKSAIVPFADGSHHLVYCMESPECWFEDFGSATLINGSTSIEIEPGFAGTVHTDQYHVFLTPHGDSRGLYVTAQTAQGFEVREQQGGSSAISFSYRLVARRKDVAAPRLKEVTLPEPAPIRK